MDNVQYQRALEEAMRLIKAFEGCRLTAYHGDGDPADTWTIGYGMTVLYGRPVRPGDVITQAEADRLLGIAVAHRMQGVDALVRPELNDHQLAALTSFVYNVGLAAFTDSTLRQEINRGDFEAAAKQFDRWVYGHPNGKAVVLAGLLHRRAAEKNEFLS